jgi:hypothetical protein
MPVFLNRFLSVALLGLLVTLPLAADETAPLRPMDEVVLFDFDDQPLGPVGLGGPLLGQPQGVSGPSITGEIVTRGSGRALRIESADVVNPYFFFEWPGNVSLQDDVVRIGFDVLFEELDSYIFRVRRAGSFADSYLSLRFSEGGFISNLLPATGTIGTYTPGESLAVLLEFDLRGGTVNIALDGVWVLEGFRHGVSGGQGIGRISFGHYTGAASGAPFEIDNLRIQASSLLGTLLINDFSGTTLGADIGTGGAAEGEPVSVASELSASFVSSGGDARELRVERASIGGVPLLVWQFLDDLNISDGLVFAEVDLIMRSATDSLFRIADSAGSEILRVTTNASGTVYARFPDEMFFGTSIGSYEVDEPFRLGLLCNLDARNCSVALDHVWVVRSREFAPATPADVDIGSFRTGLTALASVGHAFDLASIQIRTSASTGTPASLRFEQQPSATPRREPIDPAVTVRVLDPSGANVADGYTVQLEIEGPGDNFVTNDSAITSDGLAVFSSAEINDPATAIGLRARVLDTLVPIEGLSDPFDVGPGLARSMSWATQPTDALAGEALAPALAVALLDIAGSPPAVGTEIALAIAEGPSAAIASGALSVSDSGGVVSFAGFSLDRAGDYRLMPGLTSALDGPEFEPVLSDWFTIHPAAAATASFVVQPTTSQVNLPIAPSVSLTVTDAFGNPVADGTLVELVIDSGPAAGLSGALASTVDGVAVFPDLALDQPGSYTLRGRIDGVEPALQPVSESFSIQVGPPAAIEFLVAPSLTVAGEVISPGLAVRVTDAAGFAVADGVEVALALADAPAGASLGGTLLQGTVEGLASFDDLLLTRAGAYTLRAFIVDGPDAISPGFMVVAGSPVGASFAVQPGDGVVNLALAPVVRVSVFDGFGNPAGDGLAVTLALEDAPAGAIASGNLATLSAGEASFPVLAFDRPGDYRLAIDLPGIELTGNTISEWFDIRPGEAAMLVFEQQPTTTPAGQILSPAVAVRVTDASGFPVLDGTAVLLSIATGPAGATLVGTLTRTTAAGLTVFDDLTLAMAGSYVLQASVSAGPVQDSAAFEILPGAPASARFLSPPLDGTVDVPLSPGVSIHVVDAFDNDVVDGIAVALEPVIAPAGAAATGAAGLTEAGLAVFPLLAFDTVGTYQLRIRVEDEVLAGDALSPSFEIRGDALFRDRFTVD